MTASIAILDYITDSPTTAPSNTTTTTTNTTITTNTIIYDHDYYDYFDYGCTSGCTNIAIHVQYILMYIYMRQGARFFSPKVTATGQSSKKAPHHTSEAFGVSAFTCLV